MARSGPLWASYPTMVAWDPTGRPYMFTQATAPALFELGSLNAAASRTLCLIPTVPAGYGGVAG